MKKLLFLDIETTGLEPENIVWQTVYAKAVQDGTKLKVLEVVELVGKECIRNKKVKQVLRWADVLVSHNVSFEKKFLRRRKLPVPPNSYCTMINATDVCKIRMEWDETSYKWPRLEEAIRILRLEDQLNSMVKGLVRHDALYDAFAVMLLYCKLNDLSLDINGCRVKRANLWWKYFVALKYAVYYLDKDMLLLSIASNSPLLREIHLIVEFFRQWRRYREHRFSWRIAFSHALVDVSIRRSWLKKLKEEQKIERKTEVVRNTWYNLRFKHRWLERLINRNKHVEREDDIPF